MLQIILKILFTKTFNKVLKVKHIKRKIEKRSYIKIS